MEEWDRIHIVCLVLSKKSVGAWNFLTSNGRSALSPLQLQA